MSSALWSEPDPPLNPSLRPLTRQNRSGASGHVLTSRACRRRFSRLFRQIAAFTGVPPPVARRRGAAGHGSDWNDLPEELAPLQTSLRFQ